MERLELSWNRNESGHGQPYLMSESDKKSDVMAASSEATEQSVSSQAVPSGGSDFTPVIIDNSFVFGESPKLTIKESRLLRKYMKDIEPGIDFNTTARTPGGASVSCFLRFNTSFFFPEL